MCLLVKDRMIPTLASRSMPLLLSLSPPSATHRPISPTAPLCFIYRRICQMLRFLRILQIVGRKVMLLHLLLQICRAGKQQQQQHQHQLKTIKMMVERERVIG